MKKSCARSRRADCYVIITGSGGTHTKFQNMNQPFEFRKELSDAIKQKTTEK